nr:MAG TPA: hypothetical protein [Caudoviricetes sp.]DAV51716.1 MAG TPA: hypothetical protein [Bacteriophage sp.]
MNILVRSHSTLSNCINKLQFGVVKVLLFYFLVNQDINLFFSA